MRRLFLKIFLWYWLSMLIVGLTVVVVTWTTRPEFDEPPWHSDLQTTLDVYAESAVAI